MKTIDNLKDAFRSIMCAFWRAFYKKKLKDEYQARAGNSTRLFLVMDNFTNGGCGQNYNSSGERIRGVYRPTARSFEHPLVRQYSRR